MLLLFVILVGAQFVAPVLDAVGTALRLLLKKHLFNLRPQAKLQLF